MKLFTIAGGQASPGWTIARTGGKPAITLGEEGRGRTLTRLPLAGEPAPVPCDRPWTRDGETCSHCGVVSPGHGQMPAPRVTSAQLERPANAPHVLRVQPDNAESDSVAVLVRDQSGYRGGWTLLGPRTGDCPGALKPALRVKGDPASAYELEAYQGRAKRATMDANAEAERRLMHAVRHWRSLPLPALEPKVSSVTNVRGETTTETVRPRLEWQGSTLLYCEPHPRTGADRYREQVAQAEPRTEYSGARLRCLGGRDHRIGRYWPDVAKLVADHFAAQPECPPCPPVPVSNDPPEDVFDCSQRGYCAGCGKLVQYWGGPGHLGYREPQGDAPALPIVARHGVYGPAPKVQAKGHCADGGVGVPSRAPPPRDGDAGRMGGGDEVVVVLAPGEGFTISRSGRTYGGPSFLLVEWTGTELRVETLAQYDERRAQDAPAVEVLG